MAGTFSFTQPTGQIGLVFDTAELDHAIKGIVDVIPEVFEDSLEDFAETVALYLAENTPLGFKWVRGTGWQRSNVAKPGKFMGHPAMWQLRDKKKRSIIVESMVNYGAILEEGGYPEPKGHPPKGRPWEWGWRVSGGFSKQAPQGIITPFVGGKEVGIGVRRTLDDALEEYRNMVGIKLERIIKRMGT